MNRYLSRNTTIQLLEHILSSPLSSVYDYEKHRLTLSDQSGEELFDLRLPIVVPYPDVLKSNGETPLKYIILLIQSGNCAVGFFENGINLDHKVFRSYMVRKKQGTSQIKYLKTKGKSRAGSRVRLGESLEFFDNINGRLQEYFEQHKIDRIAISCSKILIHYLYNSKVRPPFEKNDVRIFKIPKHIHTPIYEVMMEVHRFLLKGELIYEEKHQTAIDAILKEVDVSL